MERQSMHLDWYWRLALEWGMVGVLIADARLAGSCAGSTRAPPLSCVDASEAAEIIANAVAACEDKAEDF
jgi:hypothetical protein